MIDFRNVLNTQFNQSEVIELIASGNQEEKLILAIRIIFTTDLSDLGWHLLQQIIDIPSLIDENFIRDFLNHRSHSFTTFRVLKFLDFIVRKNNETLNMAIQKHLAEYADQKPAEPQSSATITNIINIINLIENTPYASGAVLKILINLMGETPLPREANQLSEIKIDIIRLGEFFKNLNLSEEEKLEILIPVFNNITDTTREPQPLVAIALVVIEDEMINKAIEFFLRFITSKKKNVRESIVKALKLLIFWQRTYSHFQLDQWISKTLSLLNTNGYSDVVDEIASQSIVPAFVSLVIPVFQRKMLSVVQALLENAKSTKEMFDKIVGRSVNMLKQLEDSKSDIFEPLMELICETLCTINQTEMKYREVIQFLEIRNRSPSKYISKRSIGPSYAGYLSNNARVGLENLGNTCYLNSILQALFMTKQFCREILVTQRFEDRAVLALQELFALMLFSPRPEQNPKKVVNLIRPDDFIPGIQHDSSEFLGSLLDRLHEVDKKRMKDDQNAIKHDEDWDIEESVSADDGSISNSASSDSGVQSMDIDTVDSVKKEDASKDKIVDNTQNLYLTYIQKIFGGKISTRYLCSSCNGNSVNIDSFRDLQLSFPEKNEDENGDTQYNVQQLLEYYFTTEELTLLSDNQYHCDNCKILCNGFRCTEILEPPRNLILTLKHFRYDSRHHTRSKLLYKVYHDEFITVNVKENFSSNYMRNVEYMLYAAVIHSGTSLDSGHYYTIAREAENKWFKFNDSFVTKSSLEELRSLISPNTPYILFYQRQSNASSTIVNSESSSTSSTQPINEYLFPKYEELTSFLRNIIDDDRMNFEMMKNQHTVQPTVIASRYDPGDNDRGGSSGFNGADIPRYIY